MKRLFVFSLVTAVFFSTSQAFSAVYYAPRQPNPYDQAAANVFEGLFSGLIADSRREAQIRRQERRQQEMNREINNMLYQNAQTTALRIAARLCEVDLTEVLSELKYIMQNKNSPWNCNIEQNRVFIFDDGGNTHPTYGISIYVNPLQVSVRVSFKPSGLYQEYTANYILPESVRIKNVFYNTLGLDLFSDDKGRVIVKEVFNGSISQTKGLKAQDEIVKIDTNIMKGVPLRRLALYLSDKYEKKEKVQLSYKQNGKIKTTSFYIVIK